MIARQARTVYHSRFRRDKEGHPSYFGLLPGARATLACKAAPIADSNRYRMKPAAWFGTAALALAAALAVPACSLLQGHGPVQVGKALPRLTFVALDGSQQPLVPPPGRITFVNVFATWCPPCKAEMPDLVAFASREARYGVDVIGIDQEETAAQVEAFMKRYDIRYPVLIDTGRETKDVLGARVIPRTIVVDGHGVVRAVFSGPMTADQMHRLAAKAGANF